MTNLARRRLFTGGGTDAHQLLPWIISEQQFYDQCSRCSACSFACTENIIVKTSGGFPGIDFQQGECTFCYACADACEMPLFHPIAQQPWQQQVVVQSSCLAHQGVTCRSCEDHCEPQAINFPPKIGGQAMPSINSDLCNGCGACIQPCPTNALQMTDTQEVNCGN